VLELRRDDRPGLEVIQYEEHRKDGKDQCEDTAHSSNNTLHSSTVAECGNCHDDQEPEQGDQQQIAELPDGPEPPSLVAESERHDLGSGVEERNEHQKCTK